MKSELCGKVSYFEGWYFKHQKKKNTICFIPGMQVDKEGNASAFIQIIDRKNSFFIKYPIEEYERHREGLYVRIGENLFTARGIKLNINKKGIMVKGKIRYGELSPIGYPIMGPFAYLPMMGCKHEIVSMNHSLRGSLIVQGRKISFDDGNGYIEGDRGSTFPKSYFWTQCNSFRRKNSSITAAVADINFLSKSNKTWIPNFIKERPVRGCLALIHHEGKTYRLATYLGAGVVALGDGVVCLRQGKKSLLITTGIRKPRKLLAPNNGEMSRKIYEDVSCYARYRFFIRGTKVFDLRSSHASLEYVKK